MKNAVRTAFQAALQDHNGSGRTPVRVALSPQVMQMSAAELRAQIEREHLKNARKDQAAADDRAYLAKHGQSRVDRERRLSATSLGRAILERERTSGR